jgi:hypothetical protein
MSDPWSSSGSVDSTLLTLLEDADACFLKPPKDMDPHQFGSDDDDLHNVGLIAGPGKAPSIRCLRFYYLANHKYLSYRAEQMLDFCTLETKEYLMDRVYLNGVPLALYDFEDRMGFDPDEAEWSLERCAHALTHPKVPIHLSSLAIIIAEERGYLPQVREYGSFRRTMNLGRTRSSRHWRSGGFG